MYHILLICSPFLWKKPYQFSYFDRANICTAFLGKHENGMETDIVDYESSVLSKVISNLCITFLNSCHTICHKHHNCSNQKVLGQVLGQVLVSGYPYYSSCYMHRWYRLYAPLNMLVWAAPTVTSFRSSTYSLGLLTIASFPDALTAKANVNFCETKNTDPGHQNNTLSWKAHGFKCHCQETKFL